MQYEYDTEGDLSSLVLMTFLVVILFPLTYRTLFPKRAKTAATADFPIRIEDDSAAQEVVQPRPKVSSLGALYKSYFTVRNAFLLGGWTAVCLIGYRVATTKRETKYWNPYEILGISESATEKEIKKHYKKLSIKFHPDKVRLAVNQTLEQVQEQFVGLTKAYKALTDEEVRQNFLEHGNPDGKQDLSVGIALPTWMVEGGHSLWVLAGYCLTLLVGLPVLVGRWWYKSAKVTKDGLLNITAERYFKGIQEKMTNDELITLLCSASELDDLPVAGEQVSKLASQVAQVCGIAPSGRTKTVEVLLRAHMCRIPISDHQLLTAQDTVLRDISKLHKGLYNVALSYGYLDTQMKIFSLSSNIIQAMLPGDSALLQLPYVNRGQLNKVDADMSLSDFLELDKTSQREVLGLDGTQYERALQVARGLPVIEAAQVAFQVEGDDKVSSNAIVQLVFKLRRAGGQPLKAKDLEDEQFEEDNVEAILNVAESLAATAVADTLSWAPYYPQPPKNQFWLSMADVKQDRIIVGPLQAEDIGDKLRTFKIPFQAPPTAGLYTFQVYIKSDTYVGIDQVFHMELDVIAEETATKDEDNISEPDENTIAGQMASMKGGQVKKAYHEYESSSEEELTDSSSDDDSDED